MLALRLTTIVLVPACKVRSLVDWINTSPVLSSTWTTLNNALSCACRISTWVCNEIGVAIATFEGGPVPMLFTALTLKSYDTLLARPVTVASMRGLTPSLKAPNIASAVALNSMI